jgi:D-3-phosphoglycerate dehydrogenase
MSESIDALILDLLEFVSREERPYLEVMEAWRTSCPRLPVWEEANARGLVTRARQNGQAVVRITMAGRTFLAAARATRAP